MTESDLRYVSDAVLAYAFYFGVMGGVVGAGWLMLAGVVYRAARRYFQGR